MTPTVPCPFKCDVNSRAAEMLGVNPVDFSESYKTSETKDAYSVSSVQLDTKISSLCFMTYRTTDIYFGI